MLFKKDTPDPMGTDNAAGDPFEVDGIPEEHRVTHGRYTVIPKTKLLHNGNWIVEIVLEESRAEGRRQYDFFGPMSEYSSAEEARRAGVEHAIGRLDEE
jgi:hypothetical protein